MWKRFLCVKAIPVRGGDVGGLPGGPRRRLPKNSLRKRSPQPVLIANKKPAKGGFEILMVAGAGFEPTTFGL